MAGCSREATSLSSRLKRARVTKLVSSSRGRILIATSRLEMGSKARYTVAIPPRPSSDLILYLPTLSSAMGQVYQNPSAEEHYNHSALKRILFIAFHIPEEAELA